MDQPVDPRIFRRTMGRFATGVTVITAQTGDRIHGMTANAVSSLSLNPLLVLVCIDRRARMHEIIRNASRFAINILSAEQEALSRHFSGAKNEPPPAGLRFEEGSGVPLIAGSIAALTCTMHDVLDGGDHTIVIGEVIACRASEGEPRPLLFFDGRYHHLRVPDPAATPAPDPWINESVRIYYEEWTDQPQPALSDEPRAGCG